MFDMNGTFLENDTLSPTHMYVTTCSTTSKRLLPMNRFSTVAYSTLCMWKSLRAAVTS